MNHCISCMTIQVPRFKVVRPLPSRPNGSNLLCPFHAQFLIVISLGSVPHGVWRRHSDFKELFNKVSKYMPSKFLSFTCLILYYRRISQINRLHNTPGPYHQIYKNTILSWECVLSRQRWFRCLDKVTSFKLFLGASLCVGYNN